MTTARAVRVLSILGLPALLSSCADESEFDPGIPTGADASAVTEEKAYIDDTLIWTSTRIPVCWENATVGNAAARAIVMDAVNETWAKHSRVKFSEWDSCTSGAPGLHIRWTDSASAPHVIALGDDLDGLNDGMVLNPTFNLWAEDVCGISLTDEYCIRVIAIHEFGHALSFAHEQNRPDTPGTCLDAPQGPDGNVLVGGWDLDSVMNYCNPTWNAGGVLSDTDIEAAQLYYGPPLVQADFDNDGYADLAVGAPYEDMVIESNHGAVNVLYGGSSGVQDVADDFWYQDTSMTGDGEVGDELGHALAVGDFDFDGYYDLVMGVPGEAVGAVTHAGAFNVLYGGGSGLSVTGDQMFTEDTTGVPGVSEANDEFGTTFAVGDFNRDHYMDLAIGTPYEDVGTETNAGAVVILYGSASGLTTAGSTGWSQATTDVEGAAEAYDEFGASLAAGDFDQDGYDDLAIGVPGEVVGVVADAGAVNVLYGSSSGLVVTGDQIWNQGSLGLVETAEAADRFGTSLAAADFDDDGYFDLAVGVPGESQGTTGEGSIHVILGNAGGGLDDTGDYVLTRDGFLISGTPGTTDAMGTSLSAGYFDDDLYADLAVGIPGAAVSSLNAAGEVLVLFGTSSGIFSTTTEQFWNQDTTNIEGTAALGDEYGITLTAGDYDGDGYWDLVAGIPDENVSSLTHAGAVNVIYSTASGPNASGDQLWSQDSTGVLDAAEASDLFGEALR